MARMSARKKAENQTRAASYIGKGIVSPGAGAGVPANALLARDTTPFTFRDGSVLTLRSA